MMATSGSIDGGSSHYEKKKQRKHLELAILRGVYHGYVEEVEVAVEVLSTHFSERQAHDGKQLLDFFPDKEDRSSASVSF